MLTDEELTSDLRVAFDHASGELTPRPGLAATVRRTRHRQRVGAAAAVAAPALGIGALGTALWHNTGRPVQHTVTADSHTTTHASQGSALTLDGYRIALTAGVRTANSGYSVGNDCLVRAVATGPSVLVPGGACPLHIMSVVTTPPPGAAVLTFVVTPRGTSESLKVSIRPGSPIYLPTKLPDGTTVYVQIAPDQRVLDIGQLVDLAKGLKVAPVTANAGSGKPVG